MTKYETHVVENLERGRAIAAFVAELLARNVAPGIVFVRRQRHATVLSAALAELGVPAPIATSMTPRVERARLAAGMRAGNGPRVVVAGPVWSTGINIPGLSWVLLTGSGSAPVGLNQTSGRATRAAVGKDSFTVYDLCDVGLPTGSEFLEEHTRRRQERHEQAGFVREDPVELLAEVQRSAPSRDGSHYGNEVDVRVPWASWTVYAFFAFLIFVALAQFTRC